MAETVKRASAPQAQPAHVMSDEGLTLTSGEDGRLVNRDNRNRRAVIVRLHGKTYQHVSEDATGAWVYQRI